MVDGKRQMKKAGVQGALALDPRNGKPTKLLKKELLDWMTKRINESSEIKDLRVPTLKELVEAYVDAAEDERIKSGKPGETTVANTVKAFRQLVEFGGWKWNDKWTAITTEGLDAYLVAAVKSGKARATAWSYVQSVNGITAKWTTTHYKRRGIVCRKVDMPTFVNSRGDRYQRPTKETLAQVREWYGKLWLGNKRQWFIATMMLNFGMRTADARRCTMDWFKVKDGQVQLVYTPNKTKLTSGAIVRANVHPELWARIKEAVANFERNREVPVDLEVAADRPDVAGGKVVPTVDDGIGVAGATRDFINKVNAGLRAAVPAFAQTEKALYELRKICGDHIYQKFGAEAASAMLGDDIRTVIHFYADPSAATPEAVRVDELI